MVPLVKKLLQIEKMVMLWVPFGTNVSNQWYHWENLEHMHSLLQSHFIFEVDHGDLVVKFRTLKQEVLRFIVSHIPL